MKLSIAMCTFNGAEFLPAQLASIAAQSRQPDELVISDDGSTDQSLTIARNFAASADFTVRVEQNARRLGVVKNFEHAIAMCEGEVILLADQDDVWPSTKIMRFKQFFDDDGLGCLFSNAGRVDAAGGTLPGTLWDHIGFTRRQRRLMNRGLAFELLSERNVVTGATLGFRSRWRETLIPFPEIDGMLHDRWIALILSAVTRMNCVDECLIDYREHSRQQIGSGEAAAGVGRWIRAARETTSDDYALQARQLRLALQRLQSIAASPQRIAALQHRIAHLETRAALPSNRWRRIPLITRELTSLRYFRYANHFWSAARDLFWK